MAKVNRLHVVENSHAAEGEIIFGRSKSLGIEPENGRDHSTGEMKPSTHHGRRFSEVSGGGLGCRRNSRGFGSLGI